jgi:S-adenosylmethionine hydrolase
LELIRRRAQKTECQAIDWRLERLSASFHGRDLFAPVAARLATGRSVPGRPGTLENHDDWPDDLPAIVYIDRYGNAMTSLRAGGLPDGALLEVSGARLERARTFSDRAPGEAFWYENANGLLEIAVNGGSAADRFTLKPGLEIGFHTTG